MYMFSVLTIPTHVPTYCFFNRLQLDRLCSTKGAKEDAYKHSILLLPPVDPIVDGRSYFYIIFSGSTTQR